MAEDPRRRLRARTIPLLRLAGAQLLILGAALHNALLLDDPDWDRVLWYAAAVEAYALLAWAVLGRQRGGERRLDAGFALLVLDLVPLAATVYITGATRSWIFWVLLFRVGDQATTTFRRTLLFTHLAALAYLAVAGYVALVEGRAVAWPPELAKAAFLYMGGLYLAAAGRPAERLREHLEAALRTGRDAVARLSSQSAELERARSEAESASRTKSEFLSRVSHELRTPMNAILGFAQLLDMEELEPAHRAHVAEILEGGRHLLDIINEVMDIARVETGALAGELRAVALRPALQEVLDHAGGAAAARQVTLPAALPDACDTWVLGHERKLRQVIANLVSNAIKYNSSPGTVEISCHRRQGRLRVGIRDTGHGIRADEMEAAFTPFVRLESARESGTGTGLGLPLARALVQAMNGRLDVDSRPGDGSTFSFELPLATETQVSAREEALRAERESENAADAARGDVGTEGGVVAEGDVAGEGAGGEGHDPDASGRRPGKLVLYVEDQVENVTLVRRILERRPGVRLMTTTLGVEGLSLARQRQPDLILLDLHLPDIQGDEVLARLRQDPDTVGIPVVVVSAESSPARVEGLLAAGARAYFTMPYDVVGFLETVDEVLTSG